MIEVLTKDFLIEYFKNNKKKTIDLKHIATSEKLYFDISLSINDFDNELNFYIETSVFNNAINEGQKTLIELSNSLYHLFKEDCNWIDSGSDDIYGYDFNEEKALKFLSNINLKNFEISLIY